MGPRMNPKAAAAKGKKEEVQAGKKAVAQNALDRAEDADWGKGAKGKNAKSDDKAASAAAALARKDEAKRLLALEEASAPKTKAPQVKLVKKALPPVKAIPSFESAFEQVPEYSASGIENALDALHLVNDRTDKAALGAKAAKIEQHPERRFKAAFEAYKEAQLPIIRKERPGMRLQQYHDALYKDFQKSPDNPFNQVNIAYDSTKEEKVAALQAAREETARRLRSD